MANPWLRLWVDMPNDPKWRTIARESKQPISVVISVYLHVLVDASNAEQRGETHCNAEDVASALDCMTSDIESVLEAMQGRVLDGERVTGWEKRQPQREDSKASDRSRAYRERIATQRNAAIAPEEMRGDTEKKEQVLTQSAKRPALQAAPELLSPDQVAGTLPLVDGTDYQISKTQVAEWRDAFPAVNVTQQLKEMKVWIQANPIKRKTRKGIAKFIANWLSRAQNNPHIGQTGVGFNPVKIKFLEVNNA